MGLLRIHFLYSPRFRHNTNEIEMLFHILRCFTTRHVPQYQFVKDFLDNTCAAVSLTISELHALVLGSWLMNIDAPGTIFRH